MELKTKARLAMGAFLAACLIPSLGMLVVPERSVSANQQLAPFHSLTQEDGALNPDVFQEATDYIADHFAFRQELITADAVLTASVFRTSAEEKVILGKDGWLFYAETAEDYLHTAPLTDRQLWAAAHTLALVQEYVQERGARLLFTVAPNKATLYPEYFTNVGHPLDGPGNLDRLIPLLKAEGVPYAELREPLRRENTFLYYRLDSHWNALGAALAQQTLLQALEQKFEPFWLTHAQVVPSCHRGDLYEMVYPTGAELDWDAQYDRPFTFTHTRNPRGPDDQRIETENPSKAGSLLMFRDSFGNNLYPFMAEEFGKALFSRSMPWQLNLLDQTGADTVVIELVERNLDYLATRAPVLPAPERQLIGVPPQGQGEGRIAVAGDGSYPLEGYVCLEGALSDTDQDSPIYVRLGDCLYEASPAGEDWSKEIPFTLYVPQENLGETVSVLCMQQGALCSLPLTVQ